MLIRPEIAPNTGSIIRLCANLGAALHLVEPLGFTLDDRLLRRAGLDYHELTSVTVHPDASTLPGGTRWAFSSRADHRFDEASIHLDDVLVFGAERLGLEPADLEALAPITPLAVPMRPGNRSLNLANTVAIVAHDVWRRHGYPGAEGAPTLADGHGTTAERLDRPPFDP